MSNILDFYSRVKKREEEDLEYYNKIFPYGEPQKQKVRDTGWLNKREEC